MNVTSLQKLPVEDVARGWGGGETADDSVRLLGEEGGGGGKGGGRG